LNSSLSLFQFGLDISLSPLERYRRERGILYTNTKIGNSMLSTARSGFDAGRFKGMQVRDRRYPVVDSETGAVMSLVRCADPRGQLSKASLHSHALVRASFVGPGGVLT
jgi:hypothetical protein